MSKMIPVSCAVLLAIGAAGGAFAHGGGGGAHFGGGGAHFSSFHSAPSFHSFSSFHSAPSFHSSPSFSSSSFHSSSPSFSSSSFHSSPSSFSSFHSSPSFSTPSFHSSGSSHTGGSGGGHLDGFGSNNLNGMGMSSPPENHGMSSDISSHHHGFLFFGHHDHSVDMMQPGYGMVNTSTMAQPHHGGFLFWGHHHNSQYNSGQYANGQYGQYNNSFSNPNNMTLAHQHYNQFGTNIYSMQPPSNLVINMAPPPITQPVPIQLSVSRYFYQPTPTVAYIPSYTPNYFGYYGSTYGGYGYSPTSGMVSLLFRLFSLIGFGPHYSGLNSNAFLGTWGPQSTLSMGNDMDYNSNATNFVDNYNNFNYNGNPIAPFANLSPDGATAYNGMDVDGSNQMLAMQNPDPAYNNYGNPDPATINTNGGNMDSSSTDASNLDAQNATNQAVLNLQPAGPVDEFGQPTYEYHCKGVLGSAYTHRRALPTGSYKAPEVLGIVFTHQFWDAQNAQPDPNTTPAQPVAAQN